MSERIDRHYRDLERLTAIARRHLAAGRVEAAAAYVQIASRHAWLNHCGVFASPELEELLIELGSRLPAVGKRPRVADPRDVLHVMTQAYQTGGSTRAVECWLEQDHSRRHRVCITRQGPTPPPQSLMSRLDGPSALIRLDVRSGGLLRRAAALRAAAADADAVILHAHPFDVVPVLAFAGAAISAPVINVNHADHVFWIGMSITDMLSNMRVSGRELAAARRGIADERSTVMARPLMPRGRELSREAAKAALDVDPETVLIVTAADGTKYRPVGDVGFLDLVVPTLERHDGALLLAAGPAREGAWEQAEVRTGGRVRALGRLPDVSVLQQAADVYVDSFPFSSLTSMLEAGGFGTPAITYRGHAPACAVLGADTPGVDEHLLTPSDPEAFDRALSGAIEDANWRRETGARMERTIRETHSGDGWRDAMGEVYAQAAELAPGPTWDSVPRRTETLDLLVDGVMDQTGHSDGAPGAIRDNLGLLPPLERVSAWRELTRHGMRPPLRGAMPEWVLPHAARVRRQVRRAGERVRK